MRPCCPAFHANAVPGFLSGRRSHRDFTSGRLNIATPLLARGRVGQRLYIAIDRDPGRATRGRGLSARATSMFGVAVGGAGTAARGLQTMISGPNERRRAASASGGTNQGLRGSPAPVRLSLPPFIAASGGESGTAGQGVFHPCHGCGSPGFAFSASRVRISIHPTPARPPRDGRAGVKRGPGAPSRSAGPGYLPRRDRIPLFASRKQMAGLPPSSTAFRPQSGGEGRPP